MTKTYNKVVINNETYIDLSSDTVEDSALLDGYTAHDRNGALITGNLTPVTDVEVDGISVVTSGVAEIDLTGKADVAHTHTKSQITDFPSLATVATTGDYDDLTDKPTIPTLKNVFGKVKVGSTTIEADTTQDTLELAAGSNVTLTPDATNDKVTIAATDTTYSDFTGAASNTAGTHGLVPAPASGENHKVLFGDADWDSLFLGVDVTAQSEQFNLTLCRGNYEDSYTQLSKFPFPAATTHLNGLMSVSDKTKLDGIASGAEVNVNADWDAVSGDAQILNKPTIPSKTSDLTNDSGFITGMTILSYGNSTWQNFIDAYNSNKVVYCRASSNSNPASGSQTRLAFMAYVNNATTPTEVEFQYYRSVSTHTASQQGDQVYVYKLNKTNGWSVTIREASVKVVAGTGLGGTYSNGTMTLTGPTKVSDLTNDSGFITGYTETDPIFGASAAAGITSSNISSWNGKQDALVSGTNIKTINNNSILGSGNLSIPVPTKTSDLTNDSGFITGITSTSTPTASTVAEFDSNAKMNSTDMTSQGIDDFINSLSITGGGSGGGGSGTPIPTANTTAAFDSNANMNSSDMTTAQVDTLVGNITAAGGSLIDFFYPVGSYYETSDATFNPNISWGGTWVKVEEGRFLQATETAADVGTTVSAGLPNITGYVIQRSTNYNTGNITWTGGGALAVSSNPTGTSDGLSQVNGAIAQKRIDFDASKSNSIYGSSTTVQPPAILVYIWHRTA